MAAEETSPATAGAPMAGPGQPSAVETYRETVADLLLGEPRAKSAARPYIDEVLEDGGLAQPCKICR